MLIWYPFELQIFFSKLKVGQIALSLIELVKNLTFPFLWLLMNLLNFKLCWNFPCQRCLLNKIWGVCECKWSFQWFIFLGFSENKATGKCDIKVQEQSYQVSESMCLTQSTHSDSGQSCKHIWHFLQIFSLPPTICGWGILEPDTIFCA